MTRIASGPMDLFSGRFTKINQEEIRLIHNLQKTMEFRCVFIYCSTNVQEFLERSLNPFQSAVDHQLSQYFPYYKTKMRERELVKRLVFDKKGQSAKSRIILVVCVEQI